MTWLVCHIYKKIKSSFAVCYFYSGMGEEEGQKMSFPGDVLFEWPLTCRQFWHSDSFEISFFLIPMEISELCEYSKKVWKFC